MFSVMMGVLLGFAAVMLLLSMVVTGAVQATQSVLRLRARNLLKGVAMLIKHHTRIEDRLALRASAARVLNSGSIAGVDQVVAPASLWRLILLGPKVSWVEPQDLANALHAGLGSPDVVPQDRASAAATTVGDLLTDIERSAPGWRKRFQLFVRLLTIGWSLALAAGFQLSAPQLLADLARDPERVSGLAAQEPEVQRMADSLLSTTEYLDGVKAFDNENAVDQLALFEIRWWPRGMSFYVGPSGLNWDAVLGVVMTAVLLSFGAPFWFEQLRTLAALRDLRARYPQRAEVQMEALVDGERR